MKLRLTVEIFGDDGIVTPGTNQEKAIAEGIIVGELDITRGSGTHSTDPILTVRMRNILEAAKQTIFDDSNSITA